MFDNNVQCFQNHIAGQVFHLKRHKCIGPVERLGDGRFLFQINGPDGLDRFNNLVAQFLLDSRNFQIHDPGFEILVRIINVQVKASSFEGIAHIPVVVGRQDDKGDVYCLACADLGYGDLVITQNFQQKSFEFRV